MDRLVGLSRLRALRPVTRQALALPLLVLVLRASNRAVAGADADRHRTMDDAASRLVEYAQAQPLLRASAGPRVSIACSTTPWWRRAGPITPCCAGRCRGSWPSPSRSGRCSASSCSPACTSRSAAGSTPPPWSRYSCWPSG
ncbi:hypothetical protein [Micromonospora sp. b486]|uniref:hypothetical protein n=1 Tax=Micromonospora sp. b486 TaxID=3053986 RepID=UPI00259CE49C|nr:hypothetical protein [Micromonospora sp. b486]MDM4778160.1 hypothetical protein [Micromonospora sp. b486]